MPKATLEQWRMLKAVVEHGGFNQASDAINKSQSSIHHAVHKLEDLLGVQLLMVEGRKTLLTDAGKILLNRSIKLLDEAEKIELTASSLSQGVEAELSVAVDGAFPQSLLSDALFHTSSLYPELRIEILETILAGTNEKIQNGEVNIGISPFPIKDGLNDEITDISFIAVASLDHPLHTIENLQLDDLKAHRQIVVRDSSTQRSSNAGWLESNQRWTVSNIRTSAELVARGIGFAWLPLATAKPLLEENKLKALHISDEKPRRAKFYLNYRDADALGPASREFIGQLRLLAMQMDEH